MRTKLAALLLALALAAGCGAVPGGEPPAPPEVSAPGPSESALPPEEAPVPVEPDPPPEEPEPVPKTPEDYTQEQLDFFEYQGRTVYGFSDNFWENTDLQESMEREYCQVMDWLALTPEQLAEESDRVIANRRTSKK